MSRSVVASSGWDPARPLPARDGEEIDLDRADTTLQSLAALYGVDDFLVESPANLHHH